MCFVMYCMYLFVFLPQQLMLAAIFVFWPADEQQCCWNRILDNIDCPCCDCECVRSVPGQITDRCRPSSLKCLRRTGPVTGCRWHQMFSHLRRNLHIYIERDSQMAAALQSAWKREGKPNVILYVTLLNRLLYWLSGSVHSTYCGKIHMRFINTLICKKVIDENIWL